MLAMNRKEYLSSSRVLPKWNGNLVISANLGNVLCFKYTIFVIKVPEFIENTQGKLKWHIAIFTLHFCITMLLPKSVSFYFHYWMSILIFTVWHFFERAHAELFTKCSDYDRIAHLLCSQSLTPSKRVNLQVLHLDTSYLSFLSQLNCVAYPVPVVIKIMVWTLRWEMKNCCLNHFQIYLKRLILQGQWTMQDITSLINYCWDQDISDFWKV